MVWCGYSLREVEMWGLENVLVGLVLARWVKSGSLSHLRIALSLHSKYSTEGMSIH